MAGYSAMPKGDLEKTNADVMRLAGQASVRKVYRWEHIEKAPGTFDFELWSKFSQAYAEAGVKVCGMIHRPPAWEAEKALAVPRSLRAMYDYCRRLEQTFGGAMCAWEAYNEPDLPQSVGGLSCTHRQATSPCAVPSRVAFSQTRRQMSFV